MKSTMICHLFLNRYAACMVLNSWCRKPCVFLCTVNIFGYVEKSSITVGRRVVVDVCNYQGWKMLTSLSKIDVIVILTFYIVCVKCEMS